MLPILPKLKNIDDLKHFREQAKPKIALRFNPSAPLYHGIKRHILICGGTGCVSSGSQKILDALKRELEKKNLLDSTHIVFTGCHGFCEIGPLLQIRPGEFFYTKVTEADIPEIVSETVVSGRLIDRLLYRDHGQVNPVLSSYNIEFYAKQNRLVTANCGYIDPENVEEYLAMDGYAALEKAITSMTPDQVLEEVKKSSLRGRGGGGFPTGLKWEFSKKVENDVKYVVCNADEGDPGAFMDCSLLEGDPHRVIEGMALGAYTIGAKLGYVYVRAEYPLAVKRLKLAIKQANELGLLGDNILGTPFTFHLKIKEGAGAFVCGEETALLQSIEGQRGMPRPRPPFPAVSGLWGKPTVLNNVETWANIPGIITNGADWFTQYGTEKSKGTKVFSLAGKLRHTGLAEVPMGITIREIIFGIGGGIQDNKKFKAVQIGGPSGGCIPESLIDSPVDYDSLISAGAMMGSGGLVVLDESTCMVDLARFFLSFTQSESCGKCTPCREGTKRMLEILERITKGQGREGDIELLEEMGYNIKQTALCGLGQTCPNPVLASIRYFRQEYEAHIVDKKCPAGVCTDLLEYWVDPEKCVGCGSCKKVCPTDAISGERKQVHTVDLTKCIKCGSCIVACQKVRGAIIQR